MGEAGERAGPVGASALPFRCTGETSVRETSGPTPHEEAVITAIIAAVLFGIGLVLHLPGLSLAPLDVTFFELAGLLAAALHLAGIGTTYRARARR